MSRARRLCSAIGLGCGQFELKGEGAEGKAEKRAEKRADAEEKEVQQLEAEDRGIRGLMGAGSQHPAIPGPQMRGTRAPG